MKSLLITLIVSAVSVVFCTHDKTATPHNTPDPGELTRKRLESAAIAAEKFVADHPGYNDSVVFLIDMKVPIRKHRFFVYDLRKKQIADQGLVAHGEGSHRDSGDLVFSNVNNSHCTSLGKYAVGESYSGKFGKSYRLRGLESTNDKALDRHVVLHAYQDMADAEDTDPVFLSFGCPTVSTKFFSRLETILDNSDQKILMWIYY